ncbi:MAG: general stress protein [Pontixanthobacter sp.]
MAKHNPDLAHAIFNTHDEADRAVRDLKSAGADNDNISIVAKEDGKTKTTDGSGGEAAKDVVGKGALGGGIGAILGVAALAIPGVGPLVGAGAIAAAATGGAAVTGTVVGAVAGAIAGALEDHGVGTEDAKYYESELEKGGILVTVDTSNSKMDVADGKGVFAKHGGHNSTHARTV